MTMNHSQAKAFLADRGWSLDDVALSVAHSYNTKRDAAVDLGTKLSCDSGTAEALIAVAKKSPPGT